MLSGAANSTPSRTKPVIRIALVFLLEAGSFDNFPSFPLEVWAEQRFAVGADLTMLVLISLSILLHDLGRGHTDPSRTIRSLCRMRTRLFVLSEFFGSNNMCLRTSKAVLNSVGAHSVHEPIFMWTMACRSIKYTPDFRCPCPRLKSSGLYLTIIGESVSSV